MKCSPSDGLLGFSRLRVYLSPHLVQLTFFFFHLQSLLDGGADQRRREPDFLFSRLYVETRIADNPLRRL